MPILRVVALQVTRANGSTALHIPYMARLTKKKEETRSQCTIDTEARWPEMAQTQGASRANAASQTQGGESSDALQGRERGGLATLAHPLVRVLLGPDTAQRDGPPIACVRSKSREQNLMRAMQVGVS